MRKRPLSRASCEMTSYVCAIISVLTVAVVLAMPPLAAGQAATGGATGKTTTAATPAKTPPFTRRTPDGQPDITGLYIAFPLPGPIETSVLPPQTRQGGRAGGEFSFGINERPALQNAERRPLVVDPKDGQIPLLPWAHAKRAEIIARQERLEYLDGRVLCIAPGIPRTQIPAPVVGYQIFQKPGHVVIFYEQSHLYRVIPLDDRPPLPRGIRKAMGVSRGRWEGNTLVVEVTSFTTNFPDNNWVIGSASVPAGVPAESLTSGHGIPHSDVYRVVERYTPIDAETIRYEATIHDSKVYTQPWTISYDAMKKAPADYVPVEYACHEGNERNLQLMLGVDTTGVRLAVP